MSILARIARVRSTVSNIACAKLISNDQIVSWLQTILDACNRNFGFENQTYVNLIAGSDQVLLPIDYKIASKNQLLSIEFGDSIGRFNPTKTIVPSFGLPYFAARQIPSNQIPEPTFRNIMLNGKRRTYLVLTQAAQVTAQVAFSYQANFDIQDNRIEITLGDQPTINQTLTLLVRKNDGTVVTKNYRFVAPGTLIAGDVVIGQSLNATSNNLISKINSETTTHNMIAKANGQIITVQGNKIDLDIAGSTTSTVITINNIEAFDNTDGEVSSRIESYLEGQYKIAYASILPVKDAQKTILVQHGQALINNALRGLYANL